MTIMATMAIMETTTMMVIILTSMVPQKRQSLVEMAMVQTKMEMVMYPIILTLWCPKSASHW